MDCIRRDITRILLYVPSAKKSPNINKLIFWINESSKKYLSTSQLIYRSRQLINLFAVSSDTYGKYKSELRDYALDGNYYGWLFKKKPFKLSCHTSFWQTRNNIFLIIVKVKFSLKTRCTMKRL